jgi:CheY-like chemotaxis protein
LEHFRLLYDLSYTMELLRSPREATNLDLARVLVVHGDLAHRLALQTILQAGGYAVDVAATPSEALARLDEGEYELVLIDTEVGGPEGGHGVLAYARVKDYRPATALVTTSSRVVGKSRRGSSSHEMAIHTENLPLLLGTVAELIGLRASRRSTRGLRQAG